MRAACVTMYLILILIISSPLYRYIYKKMYTY
jgi:hypothetical protein